jgi:5-(carboxyamino)imidazole ribonucleotide mutase
MNTSHNARPLVAIVMGSASDWDVMRRAHEVLNELNVAHSVAVLSAHRMPDEMFQFAQSAESQGLRAVIAGAGGAAHLPGMIASKTLVPVLGVPVPSKHLNGLDSLYSIVQMPQGIPVATFAIGVSGAANAALFAAAMIAASSHDVGQRLAEYRARQAVAAKQMTAEVLATS